MKKSNTKALVRLLLAAALLSAVNLMLPLAAGAVESGRVEFNIKFFDKRIYYAGNDPVNVQITITNNSPAAYRFKLADERIFSLDFDIRTMSNRPLDPSDFLVRKRTQSQQIFFREIAVESGESFSFVENLHDYVNISQPGSFVVKAKVYPELYRSGTGRNPVNRAVIESNVLNLNIRPALIPGPDGIPLEMDSATGAVLVREQLAPDQVVEYMLTARQKSQWEKFFLYLDLEAMLSRDAMRRRKWLAESEEGRSRILSDYRRELQSDMVDSDIAVIPSSFSMEQTQYNNFEGTVTVLEKFNMGNFTELRRYIYQLRRKDTIWTIVDYTVINQGTE